MTTQRIAELLKEMPLINDVYDRIRAEQVFAIDDIEYDMFSTGWKSAVDLATDNLTSHLAELQSTIAEREAEIVKLMKALSIYAEEWNSHWKSGMQILEPISNEVLSTPFTPTALNELIEKVEKMTIERCALEANKSWFKDPCYIYTITNDIRALPTGQIKLEELL